MERLKTNTPLDKILGGGLERGVVTNIYGPAGSGKTNIALSSTKSCENKIVFIDTESNFSHERFQQISEKKRLKDVFFISPNDWEEQIKAIKKTKDLVEKEKIGLIIVDSIVALYRLELNQENFYQINRQLATQYSVLASIARKHNIPILVTNQIYSIGKEEIEMTSKTIAKYWSKALVELQKTDRPNHRVAILRKHRSLPEDSQIEFIITKDGLEEPKFKIF